MQLDSAKYFCGAVLKEDLSQEEKINKNPKGIWNPLHL